MQVFTCFHTSHTPISDLVLNMSQNIADLHVHDHVRFALQPYRVGTDAGAHGSPAAASQSLWPKHGRMLLTFRRARLCSVPLPPRPTLSHTSCVIVYVASQHTAPRPHRRGADGPLHTSTHGQHMHVASPPRILSSLFTIYSEP